MKVCRLCGAEFDGKDGENACRGCEETRSKARRARARANRKARGCIRQSGVDESRGALGGVYWE